MVNLGGSECMADESEGSVVNSMGCTIGSGIGTVVLGVFVSSDLLARPTGQRPAKTSHQKTS